jgi:hypothetical protein
MLGTIDAYWRTRRVIVRFQLHGREIELELIFGFHD